MNYEPVIGLEVHAWRVAQVGRQSTSRYLTASQTERRKRSAHVTCLVAKLRGHGLIAKVRNSRLYCVTRRRARHRLELPSVK